MFTLRFRKNQGTANPKNRISPTDLRWKENVQRNQKKAELFFIETERSINMLKRQALQLKSQEEKRRREEERLPLSARPITRHQALVEMRSMMRQWRDEQEYEQRRRG